GAGASARGRDTRGRASHHSSADTSPQATPIVTTIAGQRKSAMTSAAATATRNTASAAKRIPRPRATTTAYPCGGDTGGSGSPSSGASAAGGSGASAGGEAEGDVGGGAANVSASRVPRGSSDL